MVGACGRHLHPLGTAVPEAAGPVPQPVDAPPKRLARRSRPRCREARRPAGGNRLNLIPKLGMRGTGHSAQPELKPELAGPRRGEDRQWLVTMAAVTVAELIWWMTAWSLGIAPFPHLIIYLGLAFTGLGAALGLRLALGMAPTGAPWPAVLLGTMLVGVGASAFLPLKYAIPAEIPFWLDQPIMLVERILLGTDPWIL